MRLHFLPLYKNEVKITRIRALPSCAGGIIWDQSLRSKWVGKDRGPARTPARLDQ